MGRKGKTSRSKRFNKPGGLHSFKFKKGVRRNFEKLKETVTEGKKRGSFFIKKSNNLKLTFSKLSVQRAKRYMCIKDKRNIKVTLIRNDTSTLGGNRIINIDYLKTFVCEVSLHAALCLEGVKLANCEESPIRLVTEQRHGFSSLICAKCVGCGKTFNLCNGETFNYEGKSLKEINVRAVWGSMVTGEGCSPLNESMGTLGIPGINESEYCDIEHQIGDWWKQVLEEEMKAAAEEERQHAIETDSFFEGVPAITIVCDGGWSKRSHKHTYNAMTGVGVIFGQHTGKLLHIGIRNRLCYVCSRAESSNETAKEHQCFRNWTKSAQSMESDIILEGFLECEKKYGLRYMKVIADGDSSVYASIVQNVPVRGCHVQKIECANHACKCLRVHLEHLREDKKQHRSKDLLSKRKIQSIVVGSKMCH